MNDLPAEDEIWELVDHLCRICRGRHLIREIRQNLNEFRCSKCDNRVNAVSVEEVCWLSRNIETIRKKPQSLPIDKGKENNPKGLSTENLKSKII